MSFIDTATPRPQKPGCFERLKSIKDVRQAMTKQPSIVDHVLRTTLSKESVGHHGGDTLRQTVRNTMVFQLKKSIGSMRSIACTVSSAAKAVKKFSMDEDAVSVSGAVPKLLGHENHVEEIRQAVIRLVADGEVKTELAEGERVSYDRQGDLKFYTDENLQRRLGLRVHPLLCRLTQMFWLMAGHPAAISMDFDGYQGILLRIHKVLIELFDVEESKVLIREDWVRDTNATNALTYELFHLSLFELIDIWCDSLKPDDYCNLLYLLMNGIAHMQSGTFRLRRLQDINYADVVEELHLKPRTPAQIELELDALEAEMAAISAAEAADAMATAVAPVVVQGDLTPASPTAGTTGTTEILTANHTHDDDMTLNIPSGRMNQLEHHDIRPTKLHKVKLAATHATAATTFRPDAIPAREPADPPRPDVDLFGTTPQAPNPRNDVDASARVTTWAASDTSEAPASPLLDALLTTHHSSSNHHIHPSPGRHMSQAVQPTDMANVLANATSAFHSDMTKVDAPTPTLRRSTLARPVHSKRSVAYNPNLKDPTSPRKTSYQKVLAEAPTTSSGFFIKSISGFSSIPAGTPPSSLAPAQPSPKQDPTPPPQAQAHPGDATHGSSVYASRPPVFSLAGAKSPRGHPVWKPKRPGHNDRFGQGIPPPGSDQGSAAFSITGLGGHTENAMLLDAGRSINSLASSGPTMNMGPLTGNGIGILGGKPTYKPPKDVSIRPTGGVVMAPKQRDQGGLITSSPTKPETSAHPPGGLKLDDLRSPTVQNSPATSAHRDNRFATAPFDNRVAYSTAPQFDNRVGGGTKRGRQLVKQAETFASEMVQDLAAISFGNARPPSNASAPTSISGPPVSPTMRETDLRLGSPSAYSKLYRGGQRLLLHLTSQTVERDMAFDGQLVARRLSATTATPLQAKQSPEAFHGATTQPPQYDRNLANLQFSIHALNAPTSFKAQPPSPTPRHLPGKKPPPPSTGVSSPVGNGVGVVTATAIGKPR
ncbi:hypothetical protein, variant [Aphanomyces invadans]|uniref:Uncharacterized protein n=1 Tax=Aphanomyces invadans TaxID=157072 RepID=A0A024TM32_9STRA|nr:hypothetical protein, variant [Aphanomyces invadans]ETV95049.1 hypothetical protein, variant [Aphanomyces invadans]|eukprot:XP_008876221.1 hypothetical protein, variant [Aphanomyces invadans]